MLDLERTMKALFALALAALSLVAVFPSSVAQRNSATDESDPVKEIELVIHRITPKQRELQIGEFDMVVNRAEYERLKGVSGIVDVRQTCAVEYSLVNHSKKSYLLSSLHMVKNLAKGLRLEDENGVPWVLESTTVQRMRGEGVAYTVPCLAGMTHLDRDQIVDGTLRPVTPDLGSVASFPKTLRYVVKDDIWVGARVVLSDSLGGEEEVVLVGAGVLKIEE
jgi:hypothetical protein